LGGGVFVSYHGLMGSSSFTPVATRDACRRIAFPAERRLVLDTLRLGHHQPMMHGLIEVDVTRARSMLREHRARTAERLSFTAFVLACLGRAVAAHPEVHALRGWFGRMVLFEDVDVTTIIEVDVEGRKFGLAHVLRAVNRRTPREIHDEIRSVQHAGTGALPSFLRRAARVFLRLPGPVRRLAFRFLLRFPRLAKRHTGTVLLTAVGMFGGGAGWGLSAPGIHGLSIVVGGIAWRSAAEGQPGAREVLCLTVSANHELIDGAPLARFVRDLRTQLEGADCLPAVLAP
jgi:pyruvate/2-oxoglutarate dehydrogenase complex dihydrolipoamide acyltransferase (E2) component